MRPISITKEHIMHIEWEELGENRKYDLYHQMTGELILKDVNLGELMIFLRDKRMKQNGTFYAYNTGNIISWLQVFKGGNKNFNNMGILKCVAVLAGEEAKIKLVNDTSLRQGMKEIKVLTPFKVVRPRSTDGISRIFKTFWDLQEYNKTTKHKIFLYLQNRRNVIYESDTEHTFYNTGEKFKPRKNK